MGVGDALDGVDEVVVQRHGSRDLRGDSRGQFLGQRLLDDLADVGASRDVPGQDHVGDGRLSFMGSNFMSTGTELIGVGKVGPNAESFNDAVV